MEKRGSKKEREARRFRAIALLKAGHGVCEVARVVEVTPGAVSQWWSAYQREGQDGILSKPNPGAKPRLTARQRRELPRLLLKGARSFGFETELWTLERIADVIERRFGVTYHPAHVWKILGALGWSCQKPERRARERDDKAIQTWRRRAWPRIKKGPRNRAAASS